MAYQINSKYCSCCHYCKTTCPVGAISFKGTKYWIDPNKCIDCGQCAEVCNTSLITKIGEALPQPKAHSLIKKECDVVVIGGGAAGLIAAAKAVHMGHKVILLEKAKKLGGCCWFAGGYRTYYSKIHEKYRVADPRPGIYEDFVKTVGAENFDTGMLKHMLDSNSEMLDWMLESGVCTEDDFMVMDSPFDDGKAVWQGFKENIERVRIDPTIGPGSMGSAWVISFGKYCRAHGVEILTETAGKKLILDSEGKLAAVLAADPGGDLEISCKSCVIAAGAMTYNDELVSRVVPEFVDNDENEPVQKFTAPTCTGDGIVMCEGIGADTDWKNVRIVMFGPAHHPFPYPGLALTRSPYGVMVNKNGKRWGEDVAGFDIRHEFLKQPRHISYQIMDSDQVEKAAEYNLRGVGDTNGTKIMETWREGLQEELGWDTAVKCAGNLRDLAVLMGVDPEVFEAEIKAYNEECAKTPNSVKKVEDNIFNPAKVLLPIVKPPFYAFFLKIFHENAIGGIATDSNGCVTKNGVPIPGIYAAGDNIRGVMVPGDLGVSYVEKVITALTMAVTSGYFCGEEAGMYAAGE